MALGQCGNHGCPAGEELVFVYGFPDELWEWITDYVICPDGNLYTSYEDCQKYGFWGTYYVAQMWPDGSHMRTDKRHDGFGAPCGDDPEKLGPVGCRCEAQELKVSVDGGAFCRPDNCPAGQTWADGMAYGTIYKGGGMCAATACVPGSGSTSSYTRLVARPSLGCFPEMRKDYVDNIAEPLACHMLIGAGTGAVCWFTGTLTLGILCSTSASVIEAVMDLCPDFPWND